MGAAAYTAARHIAARLVSASVVALLRLRRQFSLVTDYGVIASRWEEIV